jgi:hypothetical protein
MNTKPGKVIFKAQTKDKNYSIECEQTKNKSSGDPLYIVRWFSGKEVTRLFYTPSAKTAQNRIDEDITSAHKYDGVDYITIKKFKPMKIR